jgi:single-strand DNA-binding protein
MSSFNKVLLMGNLTRDPQMRYLPNSQTAITEFGMAVNRKYKTSAGEDREEVLFIDCTAWGRTGEVINQYLQKGKPIFVEGHLKLDQWEDKNGGGKRSKISVVVDKFQFIGGPAGGGSDDRDMDQSGGGEYDQRPASSTRGRGTASGAGRAVAAKGAATATKAPPAEEPFDDQEQFGEEDIPFD